MTSGPSCSPVTRLALALLAAAASPAVQGLNPPVPTLVWMEDFAKHEPDTAWLGQGDLIIRADCGSRGGPCVEANYQPTDRGSNRMVFNRPLPPADAYTLSYDIYFEPGFEWVRGGKLPGLGPQNPLTGCQASEPDRWSMRVMWSTEGRIRLYGYGQSDAGICGETMAADDAVRLTTGRYHALSLYVRLNDPDKSNGLAELYLDGELVVRRDQLRLRARNDASTDISRFMFATFHGGSHPSWAPSVPVQARFDNFSILSGHHIRRGPGHP